MLLKVAYKVFFMLEKLAVDSQGRSANYDGVRECVQSTAEGIKEARNNFPQLYKEVDEFIDSCEDLSEIAMPRLQKKGHRSYGQTEHNLGKSTFEYFSRQCYEIFDTVAVKLQNRFDASKPGLKAYCGLFKCLFGSVDDLDRPFQSLTVGYFTAAYTQILKIPGSAFNAVPPGKISFRRLCRLLNCQSTI